MIDVTFLRHAETEANAAGLWQGHGNSPLTVRGRAQLARLAARLLGERFDVVVSSDLDRTTATAEVLDVGPVERDVRWREADLGQWEGLSREVIFSEYRHVIDAMRAGEDPPFGGTGERLSDVRARIQEALADLVKRLPDGARALVVTHGGVVRGVVGGALGVSRPVRLGSPFNTSLTTVRYDPEPRTHDPVPVPAQILTFNDIDHLSGSDSDAETSVIIVRHGESEGNASGRWQGRYDADLTARGEEQARLLAKSIGDFDAIYSSPLRRALRTAEAVSEVDGTPIEILDDLAEFDFGAWENLDPADIERRWPDEFAAIYRDGRDLPRGTTGESYADGAARLRAVLDDIVSRHRGERVAVFSHGGVTRALAGSLLELDFSTRRRVGVLDNTGRSTVIVGRDQRLLIGDWNVTSHLAPLGIVE